MWNIWIWIIYINMSRELFQNKLFFCAAVHRHLTVSLNLTQQLQLMWWRTAPVTLTYDQTGTVKKKHPNQTQKAWWCTLRKRAMTLHLVNNTWPARLSGQQENELLHKHWKSRSSCSKLISFCRIDRTAFREMYSQNRQWRVIHTLEPGDWTGHFYQELSWNKHFPNSPLSLWFVCLISTCYLLLFQCQNTAHQSWHGQSAWTSVTHKHTLLVIWEA